MTQQAKTQPSAKLAWKKLYLCQVCETLSEEHGGPLYECDDDGRFNRAASYNDNHQCDSCLKFCPKVAEESCESCEEGEVEVAWGLQCFCCDEWHRFE